MPIVDKAETVPLSVHRAALEELDELRETLRQIEQPGPVSHEDAESRLRVAWDLTKTQAYILRRLIMATRPIKIELLNGWPTEKDPEPKTIDVLVCRLREKVSGFGVDIQCIHGSGYVVPDEIKDALVDVMEGRASVVSGPVIGPPVSRPRAFSSTDALGLIGEDDLLTVREIAERLDVPAHKARWCVQQWRKRGWVIGAQRERSSREFEYCLTDEGARVSREVMI